MKQTKYLKCECQHCSGRIEFPAEMIGQSLDCPHCSQQTELTLPAPPVDEDAPARRTAWIWAGVVIVVIGVIATGVSVVWLNRIAARGKHRSQRTAVSVNNVPAPPTSPEAALPSPVSNSLVVSSIAVDKARGSALVYATGIVKNQSDRQRFGVKVELDLFDRSQARIGTASDYQPVLEPKGEWHFKALVIEAKAVSAKLAAIKEDQ